MNIMLLRDFKQWMHVVFVPCLKPDLAVEFSLLPFHLTELSLECFVLIGHQLEPVLERRALLFMTTNQFAVDLILKVTKDSN